MVLDTTLKPLSMVHAKDFSKCLSLSERRKYAKFLHELKCIAGRLFGIHVDVTLFEPADDDESGDCCNLFVPANHPHYDTVINCVHTLCAKYGIEEGRYYKVSRGMFYPYADYSKPKVLGAYIYIYFIYPWCDPNF